MKNKIVTFIIGLVVGVIIATIGFLTYGKMKAENIPSNEKPQMMGMRDGEEPPEKPDGIGGQREGMPKQMNNEKTTKQTSADDISTGTEVTQSEINLSEYDTNITITKAGEYTITGEFKNSVIINAESDVKLNLKNVDIKSKQTSSIANISNNDLTITLLDNTINNLSDGGSSEYDGCIYSKGNLIINGNGTLNVYGNQEEGEGIATETKNITINSGIINIQSQDDGLNAGGDGGVITINGGNIFIKANGDGIDSNKNLIINGGTVYTIGSAKGGDAGIDTDEGFEINGGDVIALGSDMLEKPETTSTQKSICFQLTNTINEGSNISIKDGNGDEITSFEAKEQFKTLIISNEKITTGTYYIYKDGEKTNYTAQIK